MKKIIFAIILSFFLAAPVSAHQPRLIYELPNPTAENPIVISNPDVSQAFYGELKGQPDFYSITLNKNQEIYFGLLSPDIDGAKKDFRLNFIEDKKLFVANTYLEGATVEWTKFYEEFGGDNYWKGPEGNFYLQPGENLFGIYNPELKGKYVLVVGTKEAFPIGESWNAIKSLPSMKSDFFGKSSFTAYFNRIGEFMALAILALLIAIAVVFLTARYFRKQNVKRLNFKSGKSKINNSKV